MKKQMIFFALGKDRPGIVRDVSAYLFEHGANIEDSRMAVLGSQFTVTSLISCDESQEAAIRDNIATLVQAGLEASLYAIDATGEVQPAKTHALEFEITAMDHPGIVQAVVNLLHELDFNIEELDTSVTPAPMSATPLFNLKLVAKAGEKSLVTKAKRDLAKLAAREDLDLIFNN